MKSTLSILAILVAGPALSQAQFEIDFAKRVLAQAQEQSLNAGREYCGYIGVNSDGQLAATKARRGRPDVCRPRNPPRSWRDIIASYHTHGTFSENADSEVPSSSDIAAVVNEGIDGYLITPGGRVWYIDGQTSSARQICGLRCMQSDPNFEPGYAGPIKPQYSLNDILVREDENR